MSAAHDEQTLAAAYVLDALEPAERRAFEAHVADCATCAEEVRALRPVADALAHSVPQRTPRRELRARVLDSIVPGAATTPAVVVPPARTATSSWLALAAALVFAVGAGAYAWQLQLRVRTLEGRLDRAEQRASSAEREVAVARRTASDTQCGSSSLGSPRRPRRAPARCGAAIAAWCSPPPTFLRLRPVASIRCGL